MKTAIIIAAFVTASTAIYAQDNSPRQSVDAAPTLSAAVNAFEKIAKQRTSTETRASAMKAGVQPVTRDWEIDSTHLIEKSRELPKLKGAARQRKTQEVIDHALRLVANDSRVGNEDREMETYGAIRSLLAALVREASTTTATK